MINSGCGDLKFLVCNIVSDKNGTVKADKGLILCLFL